MSKISFLSEGDMIKQALIGLSLAGILTVGPITLPPYTQSVTLEQKVEKSFPNKKMGEIENFRQYSDDVMKIVAEKMKISLKENIPKPRIVTNDEITQKEFNNLLGYPDDFFNTMCPYYFDNVNTILVLNELKIDTLAHEFVHYFQVKYRNYDLHNGPADAFEQEAVSIQHWFRDNYIK